MAGGTFPTSLPTYTVTAGAETANGAAGGTGLSGLLNQFESDVTALSAKVGIGASTPAANKVLFGTGTGTTAWQSLTSANLLALMSDETGTGLAVFNNSPTLTTPTIGDFTNSQHTHANTAGGGQLTATAFANNAITAPLLATDAITLGYAQITTTFSTASTSSVLVTGLTTTVTIPAGGRRVKITAFARALYTGSASTSAQCIMTIWDGTVGSGTQLSETFTNSNGSANSGNGGVAIAVVSPSAGSKTYNVGFAAGVTGTANLQAGSAFPAFILVEAI